jgi:hypothetical protein
MPRFRMSKSCLCAIALLSLSPTLPAQTQIPADELSLHAAPYFPSPAAGIIRSQVELVEVPAVVRDSNGSAVPNLTREDFELLDSGKKQKISAFSVETSSRAGEPTEPAMSPAPGTPAPQSKSEPPPRSLFPKPWRPTTWSRSLQRLCPKPWSSPPTSPRCARPSKQWRPYQILR